jgi:protein TonB
MNITVDTTGAVQGLTIASGPPMLQQSAGDAVQQYKYKPFQVNGKAVVAKFPVSVAYTLGN